MNLLTHTFSEQAQALADAAALLQALDTFKPFCDGYQKRSIDPWRVLAHLWHPGRYNEALRLFQEGKRPPRIHVQEVVFVRQGWQDRYYIVSDGNHRTLAAREAGLKTIPALIGGTIVAPIPRYVLEDDMLWYRPPNGLMRQVRRVAEETKIVLSALGVALL